MKNGLDLPRFQFLILSLKYDGRLVTWVSGEWNARWNNLKKQPARWLSRCNLTQLQFNPVLVARQAGPINVIWNIPVALIRFQACRQGLKVCHLARGGSNIPASRHTWWRLFKIDHKDFFEYID